MKKYISIITSAFFIFIFISITSCKKDFLDVNTDPNNPSDVTPDLLLPAAIAQTAFITGGQYEILGAFWSQYYTQGPTGNQYNNYDQYQIPNTTFDRQWTELYSSSLEDFKTIVEKGEAANKPNYAAIGYIMQAYIFQILTDLHGDIPFSEALQGTTNIAPRFDSQMSIYENLITMIDKGISLIDYSSNAVIPGNDDFIFHGEMVYWEEFANTLKLRIYIRESDILPNIAAAGITAMTNNNAAYLQNGEDAFMQFFDATGYQNPIYAQIQSLGNQNLLASNTAINFLVNNNDPRIDIFYKPAATGPAAGNHSGINQGEGKTPSFNPAAKPDDYSQPGTAVAGPAAPVTFMSAAESYFLQAEAVIKGLMPGDAKLLYEDGIQASFDRWNLGADTAYINQPSISFPAGGSQADKLKAIITQKWAALCNNQSVESWNEWRRTGYPDFFVVSATSLIGNQFPARLPYPNSEIQTNPNTPAQLDLTAKVWWDVN